ncbi:MAG: hypothetical protein IAF02_11030 [Anaerolineae bacterium]|nr:hypothetical protein [Anaerolineae bacterium]
MKHIKYLFVFSIVLMVLAGCQKVSDTRTEFCDSLRGVGADAVAFKEAKVTEPVDEFRTKVEALQQKKTNLERLARITSIDGLDKVVAAIDAVAQTATEISGNTLGPAVEKVNTAGANLESAYLELNDAVCAAK